MEQLLEEIILYMDKNHAFLMELKNVNYEDAGSYIVNRLQMNDFKQENIKIIKPQNKVIVKDQIAEIKSSFKYKNISSSYIYIILSAETMNQFAYNSLLKFLEEPTNHTIAILVTNNINLIPETIKSRCIVKRNQEMVTEVSDVKFSELMQLIKNNDYISYCEEISEFVAEDAQFINNFIIFLIINSENVNKRIALNHLINQSKFNVNKNLLIDELYYIIINKEN